MTIRIMGQVSTQLGIKTPTFLRRRMMPMPKMIKPKAILPSLFDFLKFFMAWCVNVMVKSTLDASREEHTIGRPEEKVGKGAQNVGEIAAVFFYRFESLRESRNSAYSKSSGVVILMFSGLPKIRLTSQP